jgi:hypothetical protein
MHLSVAELRLLPGPMIRRSTQLSLLQMHCLQTFDSYNKQQQHWLKNNDTSDNSSTEQGSAHLRHSTHDCLAVTAAPAAAPFNEALNCSVLL